LEAAFINSWKVDEEDFKLSMVLKVSSVFYQELVSPVFFGLPFYKIRFPKDICGLFY